MSTDEILGGEDAPVESQRIVRKKVSKKKRTRRTQAQMRAAAAASDPVNASVSRDEQAHKPKRPARIPLGQGKNMSISPELKAKLDSEGREAHWFSNKDGKLERAQGAWWEFVKDEQGNNITRPSGARILFLMAIPKEYADKDRALKASKVTDTMRRESAIGQGEYAPDGGDSAVTIE